MHSATILRRQATQRQERKMSTRSRIILPPLPPPPPRILRPQRRTHLWTEEELNLISFLRLHHQWTLDRIRKTYLPSVTKGALKSAYRRIPAQARVYRASIAASLITGVHSAGASLVTQNGTPLHSSRQGPSRDSLLALGPSLQPRANVEALALSATSSGNGNRAITRDNNTARYNLRPNRPADFGERRPQYPIDRLRFPRFFKAWKDHSERRTVPDGDYVPPSHSPTPDPSDRSPSVVSSQLSDASSLELFGLEARSVGSSDRGSVTPNAPSDGSSSEFFSAEERLTPPWPTL